MMPPLPRGKAVLVIRPLPAAQAVVTSLQDRGWRAVAGPLAEYVPISDAWPNLKAYQAFILTSSRAIPFLKRVCDEQDFWIPVFCVGKVTAAAAKKAGFSQIIYAKTGAQDLIPLLTQHSHIKKVLHICGEDIAHDLSVPLASLGVVLEKKVVYRARLLPSLPPAIEEALLCGDFSTVLFFSARIAEHFCKLYPQSLYLDLEAVCLSGRIAASLQPYAWRHVKVAVKPTTEDLLACLSDP